MSPVVVLARPVPDAARARTDPASIGASAPGPAAGRRRAWAAAGSPVARAQRVTLLLLAVAIMAAADLFMTITWVTSVGMIELNPIARAVMAYESPLLLVLWRTATLVLGLGTMFYFRRRASSELGAWICFIAMTALSFYWLAFNTGISALSPEFLALASATDPRFVLIDP